MYGHGAGSGSSENLRDVASTELQSGSPGINTPIARVLCIVYRYMSHLYEPVSMLSTLEERVDVQVPYCYHYKLLGLLTDPHLQLLSGGLLRHMDIIHRNPRAQNRITC